MDTSRTAKEYQNGNQWAADHWEDRLRWLDDVCDDLKVLKVRNWKELAMDRKAWNDLSEKAKTTKGCSANGRKMAITAYIVLPFSTFTSPI
jgi:hypothetical protein